MTKSEEKLLELVLEKVEGLEAKVEEARQEAAEAREMADAAKETADSSGGNVVHNHYHTHYYNPAPRYPRYPSGPYWNNWPYYTTWCSSDANSLPNSGTFGISGGSQSISAASAGSGGMTYNANSTVLNKLEDAGSYQVLALVGS